MASREIVKIDEELCDGCGDCVPSCAEGAIQIIDGKARLVSDALCDGLGNCLGECPQGAISIEMRDADAFDQEAVELHLGSQNTSESTAEGVAAKTPGVPGEPATPPAPQMAMAPHAAGGCPGSRLQQFAPAGGEAAAPDLSAQPTELRQWPIQLHLVPPTAPFFKNADVLLAADCCAFARGDFHAKYMKNRALAIACPKLDQVLEIYLQKLTAMIDQAEINTLTVVIMEVPCCGGLQQLAQQAVQQASRKIPVKRVVVGVRGDILAEEWI